VNLGQVFAGQRVGVKQVTEQIWLVAFMEYDLGYFDAETCRLEPIALSGQAKTGKLWTGQNRQFPAADRDR
jgi:hypothetical protein